MGIGSDVLDIAAIATGALLVPLLWLFLFLVLWEDRAYAQSIGFERWTFWLLTGAVVLSLFAELPLFPFDGDYLAVNIGGAIVPLALSAALFAYFAPPRSRSLPMFLGIFGAEAVVSFAVVVLVASPVLQTLGVVAVATLATVGAAALPSTVGATRSVRALVGLSSAVLVLTFLVSSTVPGVGIEVGFPQYLVGPVAAGAIAAILGSYLYGSEAGRSAALAFAATAFGVIVGADLLRQPPLYASGLKGLYVIGGGNYSDLVYLSPLLAFAIAYLFLRYTEGARAPVAGGIALDPTSPTGALAEGVRASFEGSPEASLAMSRDASHAAAEQARVLLGAPAARPGHPWHGLPVPGWIVADQANLDTVSQRGPFERLEAERGAQMARALVRVGQHITIARFASVGRRTAAFFVDLVVVLLPAILVWYELLTRAPNVNDGLKGLAMATASYGFVAVAVLYFAVLASVTGSSVGKWLFHLEVSDRAGHRPGFLRSLVRESPKLVILSVLGSLLPALLGFFLGGSAEVFGLPSIAGGIFALILLGLLALTFAVSGAVAVVAISISAERQRVGDLWAGTWVLNRRSTTGPAGAPTGSAVPAEGASSESAGS